MTTGASLTGSASVRKLQTVLHAKAKEEPDRRFHALVDKVWREDFLLEAWGLVRRNGGGGWSGRYDGRGHRGVRSGALGRGTVAGSEGRHLRAESGTTGADPEEAAREVPSLGHTAPFVVAHLQVGLTMQNLDAPLADDGTERAGVFLTNALTGWEPHMNKPLPFPELEEERDRADRVKQDLPAASGEHRAVRQTRGDGRD